MYPSRQAWQHPRFTDRRAAGAVLAQYLGEIERREDVVVLALPRGGVPVAYEVAEALGLPLDVFLVHKLRVPGHPELALGAIASKGFQVLSSRVIAAFRIPSEEVKAASSREREQIGRQERLYRGGRAPVEIRDRTVVLVDDGIATGATMRAAVAAVRSLRPDRVVVAAPVGSRAACQVLKSVADRVVCALVTEPFMSVSQWYQHFDHVGDAEVQRLMAEAACASAPAR